MILARGFGVWRLVAFVAASHLDALRFMSTKRHRFYEQVSQRWSLSIYLSFYLSTPAPSPFLSLSLSLAVSLARSLARSLLLTLSLSHSLACAIIRYEVRMVAHAKVVNMLTSVVFVPISSYSTPCDGKSTPNGPQASSSSASSASPSSLSSPPAYETSGTLEVMHARGGHR